LNNKATWADEKFLKLLAERADKLRTTVKGNIAPDLVMETPEGKSITLHTTQAAFTILFFWKPDCEVCKTEITKLLNLFHQYKNNSVKVFAVYVHADRVIWDKAINELQLDWINGYDPLLKSNFMQLYKVQTTPQMFLLDKDKRIIAKGIKVEQMSKLLMERMKK
jgi:thiol-disulfide isomerase/thioredoxin